MRQGVGCFCTGAVNYGSPAGRTFLLRLLGQSSYARFDITTMNEAWLEANIINAHSLLDMMCMDCGYHCVRTNVNAVQQGRGVDCFCTAGVPWKSVEGHAQMMALFQKYQPSADITRMNLEWWMDNIEDCYSSLIGTCVRCNIESSSTRITHFVDRKVLSCHCTEHSEDVLFAFLETIGDPKRQAGACFSLETGHRLPIDFQLDNTFIEMDGPEHGSRSTDLAHKDLFKEKWALSRGFSVIRVEKGAVCADRPGWKEYLQVQIARCNSSDTPKLVVPKDALLYSRGIYAELHAESFSWTTVGDVRIASPL